MPTALTHEYRVRKNFGKIRKIVEIPNLIQMQKKLIALLLHLDKIRYFHDLSDFPEILANPVFMG